mgnify:CR=1 FL=1
MRRILDRSPYRILIRLRPWMTGKQPPDQPRRSQHHPMPLNHLFSKLRACRMVRAVAVQEEMSQWPVIGREGGLIELDQADQGFPWKAQSITYYVSSIRYSHAIHNT